MIYIRKTHMKMNEFLFLACGYTQQSSQQSSNIVIYLLTMLEKERKNIIYFLLSALHTHIYCRLHCHNNCRNFIKKKRGKWYKTREGYQKKIVCSGRSVEGIAEKNTLTGWRSEFLLYIFRMVTKRKRVYHSLDKMEKIGNEKCRAKYI